jgi:hypothetical protein
MRLVIADTLDDELQSPDVDAQRTSMVVSRLEFPGEEPSSEDLRVESLPAH